MYQRFVKRGLDVFLSLLAIVLLSPLMLVVAVFVKVKLGSPVLFRQKRPGRGEKIFEMMKFRSMTDQRDESGNLLPDEVRLTRFGRLLRSTSLDELPELFNILKGDMSIVGPRPLLVRDMVFMTPDQRRRHTVRQGLTGLAQINGRNNISWEEKLEWDLKYIEHITFAGDLKILFQTVAKVFARDGIETEGMSTAEDLGDYLLRGGKIGQIEYQEGLEEASRRLQEG